MKHLGKLPIPLDCANSQKKKEATELNKTDYLSDFDLLWKFVIISQMSVQFQCCVFSSANL